MRPHSTHKLIPRHWLSGRALTMYIALLPPVACSFSCAQASQPLLQKANLCEVMQDPETYADHRLIMSAIVLGEDPKKLMIIWPECQFGMKLVIPGAVEPHLDVQSLYRAVKQGNPGTTDRDITRQFIGVFRYSKVGSLFEFVVEAIAPIGRHK